METVVGVEGSDEGKCEESGVEKSSSSLSSPKQIADPVVYKLVRVEGDGRLVPATDDEVMEVEEFLVDEKIELPVVTDAENVECISNEESSSGKSHKESSEGLSHSENTEPDAKLSARLEYIVEMLQEVKQEEKLRLACGSPDHSSAFMPVDSQCSDQHDKFPAIDKKLQCEIPVQEIVPSSDLSLDDTHINESARIGECSKPPDGPIESGSPASVICNSLKPDFYTLKGEICLDNLSIRELHGLFRANFGRETTVKDKLWLKRRIAMGLTNSCDVSTTTFTIIDNKLVNKGTDNSVQNADGMLPEGSDGEAKNLGYETSPTSHSSQMENHQIVLGKRLGNLSVELDCGCDELQMEHRGAKRVRKPTKRYIEELSEVESRDYTPKVISSAKNTGQGQTSPKYCIRPPGNAPLNERTIVTRLDSLGGSGVQVPFVSRVRRSRPRKNIMALMKFDSSGMGVAAKLVQEAHSVHSSPPESEHADKVLKVRSASEQIQPLFAAEPEKDKRRSVMSTIELGKNLGLKQTDSSEDNSDDGIATVPTAKGGMRRKHHRAWTLVEVIKLVEGVSKCGTGRWSEIKRLSFASYSYRTSVDLKDKWRNLLKASFAQTPPDDGVNSRKHASVPIPAAILLKVRELAEMHAQVPPNLGPGKQPSVSRSVHQSVHQTRSGYL